jgi:hypothetical protein
MSTGRPSLLSTSIASSATAPACSSLRLACFRSSSSTATSRVPPVTGMTFRCLLPSCRNFTFRLALSTAKVSGVTRPLTTDSPSPKFAFTTARSEAPLTGSRVKQTPAASEATSCCTTTAPRKSRIPRSRRYWRAWGLRKEAQHRSSASATSRKPFTPRTESYCPAKLAPSRSSATAEERTAQRCSPPSSRSSSPSRLRSGSATASGSVEARIRS